MSNWDLRGCGHKPTVHEAEEYDYRYGCESNGHAERYEQTARVHLSWTDGQDEPQFAWVVEMKDGSFWFVEGWHDYTGWDCRSGMEFHAAESLEHAIRLAPDDPRRAWLETP